MRWVLDLPREGLVIQKAAAPNLAITPTAIEELLDEVYGHIADRRLVATLIPRLIAMAVAGADWIAELLAASNYIGPSDRTLQALTVARDSYIAGINATTRYRIRNALLNGVDTGATPREMSQAVQDVFGSAIDFRSESIALTEGGMYWETGAYREMQDLGGLVRDWVTMRDKKVRDSHMEMDGQCRPLDVAFTSGDGYPLLYPRDPDGEFKEIVNCRCFAAPIAGRCDGRGFRLGTEARREAFWKSANAALNQAKRPIRQAMVAIFTEQRAAVLAALQRRVA